MAVAGGGGEGAAPPPPGGYYAPPPTPPRRRGLSPWAWVGIGCATLAVFGFAGCAAIIGAFTNSVRQSANQPLDTQQLNKQLSGVPRYPGARVDEEMTKVVRATFDVMNKIPFSKARFHAGAYRVPNIPPDRVIAWYDKNLKAAGWKPMTNVPSGFSKPQVNIREQRQYVKGDQQLVVQVGSERQRRSRDGTGGTSPGDGEAASDGKGSTVFLTKVTGVPTGQ